MAHLACFSGLPVEPSALLDYHRCVAQALLSPSSAPRSPGSGYEPSLKASAASPFAGEALVTPPSQLRPWDRYELEYCALVGSATSACTTMWCDATAELNANTKCQLTGLQPNIQYRVIAVAYQGATIRSLTSAPSDFSTLALS